jgi:hypothetical protein
MASTHDSSLVSPAGDYELFARARYFNGQKATTRSLSCELTGSGAALDEEQVEVPPESPATLSLGAPVHLDSAQKVSMLCSTEDGPVETNELTAIRVGTLHEQ